MVLLCERCGRFTAEEGVTVACRCGGALRVQPVHTLTLEDYQDLRGLISRLEAFAVNMRVENALLRELLLHSARVMRRLIGVAHS